MVKPEDAAAVLKIMEAAIKSASSGKREGISLI